MNEIIFLIGAMLGAGLAGMIESLKPKPKVKTFKRKKKGGVRKVRVYNYKAA